MGQRRIGVGSDGKVEGKGRNENWKRGTGKHREEEVV